MNKTLVCFAAGLVLLGGLGTYNAINRMGKAPVERKDLTAVGEITFKEATVLQHATGYVLDTTYDMRYSFQASDGQLYIGEDKLTESQYNRLSKGDKVTVQYHSHHPSINASQYGHYVAVEDLPSASNTMRLAVCSGALVVGLVLLAFGLRISRPHAIQERKVARANNSHALG